MDKKAIRKNILNALKSMSPEEHADRSREAIRRLRADSRYIEAGTIGVTISRFPELDTRPLVEAAWSDGKRVASPKCAPSDRSMQFRWIQSYEELETVYMDLLEPAEDRTLPAGKDEIDLLIVPGVAYSDSGYRVGFGGGYYDRYLMQFGGDRVSLAFEEQLCGEVPVEPHDIPVNSIFTERRMVDCRGGSANGNRL
ncbi:5-formyltetrahydrofolate cyclo-ligase [Bhargavaea cecembensis]|uniref:5-formyltetrahydrofolate cyclo-ligase n=1 Tax=Bhargavaea cecembensis TaxID=394098 RepID=A0A161R9V0_9BACL|nr:5-formyltetrahydrofolate cyclo-ligase [Bhargavaea cecembensis]KZE40115.1 5-formyltetrahydrofolate cyclo-ligase [Bhargavaea cecembensis]